MSLKNPAQLSLLAHVFCSTEELLLRFCCKSQPPGRMRTRLAGGSEAAGSLKHSSPLKPLGVCLSANPKDTESSGMHDAAANSRCGALPGGCHSTERQT